MCVCVSCVTHTYRDNGLVGVTEVSVFPGCGLGWMNRVVPSHVGSPAPWAESRIPLMWTPTFPGLLPGKNRVVCLGFGGKSVPRNVTLWGAWGGLARRPCISQLLRLRDIWGVRGVRPHSLQRIPTLSTYKTHCWHNHILYLQTEPSGAAWTQRGTQLSLGSTAQMPHTRHFTVWTTDPFWLNITPLNDKICLLRSPETHPSA